MKKNVIVSLADANYYPLLDELVNSIKQFKESENIAICILDAGLEDKQKEALLKKVDEVNPQSGILEFQAIKLKIKSGLKVRFPEHFYQDIFPIITSICGLIVMLG